MCGIFARFFSPQTEVDDDETRRLFTQTDHRGPDGSFLIKVSHATYQFCMGFHHLSMVAASRSSQPIELQTPTHKLWLACNGEIYNWRELQQRHELEMEGSSDCEVIAHLFLKFGLHETLLMLRGEFAFILVALDQRTQEAEAFMARDRFGVRPLYYSVEEGMVHAASEGKSISSSAAKQQLPPQSYLTFKLNPVGPPTQVRYYFPSSPCRLLRKKRIFDLLAQAVDYRLDTYRDIGCLLSGGLDSSVIGALVARLEPQAQFFTIGLRGSRDVQFARQVARHLGVESRHHILEFTPEKGIRALERVIFHLETYDVTTIRASIPQFLMARYISKHTNVRALFSGEGSDELFAGYQYNKRAPNAIALRNNILMRLRNLHKFDNLRTDRTMAAFGLEVRLPFLDHALVEEVMCIDPNHLMPHNGVEKHLLREIISEQHLLPESIVWRPKDAFSDAVSASTTGGTWIDHLKDYAATRVTDEQLNLFRMSAPTNLPMMTKESLLYLQIYTRFFGWPSRLEKKDYWMPSWSNETDPSATVLSVFSAAGVPTVQQGRRDSLESISSETSLQSEASLQKESNLQSESNLQKVPL